MEPQEQALTRLIALEKPANRSAGKKRSTNTQMIGQSLVIAFALFLVRFIAEEAAFQRARRTAAGARFPVGIGLRILFRPGGPFLILVGYKMTQQASNNFDWVMAFLVALMGLGCILGEPGEIEATPNALIQRSLLGLKKRIIPWEGAAASYPVALRQVLVVGANGTNITHSQYHVGQSEFLYQLQRHKVYIQS